MIFGASLLGVEGKEGMDLSQQDTIIQIAGLSKIFSSGEHPVRALEDIDLSIRRGSIFGIIGMSGAGKSTLVRCMNFLERPTTGTVVVDGMDLGELYETDLRQARQTIGMIFQQFNLLMQRTALGNVMFPLEISGVKGPEAKEKARALLAQVGLADKENAYPSQLSGGQKQRVAIARALANDPKVLLCDEATSALDPATTRSILALLREINTRTGITIVIITHEMSVVEEICTDVAIIDEHRIVETGSVEKIFTSPSSAAAKRMMFPVTAEGDFPPGGRCCRIVFAGNSSFEPVIANLVLEFRKPVNILFADTKDIDGKAHGQMLIQLPDDRETGDRMLTYLSSRGIHVEELNEHAE